ncbi:hypothetical protein ACOLNO_002948 [Vibrio parahaemolyticus]
MTIVEIIEKAMNPKSNLSSRFVAMRTEFDQIVCGFIHIDFAAISNFKNTDSQFEKIISNLDPQITMFDRPITGKLADVVYRRIYKPLEYQNREDVLINDYLKSVLVDNIIYPPMTVKYEVNKFAHQSVLEPLEPSTFAGFLYDLHETLVDEIVEFYERTNDLVSSLNILINYDLNQSKAIKKVGFDKADFQRQIVESDKLYERVFDVDSLSIYKVKNCFILRDRDTSIRITKNCIGDYRLIKKITENYYETKS